METKKAYGVVTAVGAKLGERARTDDALMSTLRAAPDLETFRAQVRSATSGLLPVSLVESFLNDVLTDADWVQWRARLLIQMRLTKEGGKPAPGHEAGRGVRRNDEGKQR